METMALKTMIVVGLACWVRPIFDPPSQAHKDDVLSQFATRKRAKCLLGYGVGVMVLNLVGLIGLFFEPLIFRWVFLMGVVARIAGSWFAPVAAKKPRHDLFFGELDSLVDGGILALVFFASSSLEQ